MIGLVGLRDRDHAVLAREGPGERLRHDVEVEVERVELDVGQARRGRRGPGRSAPRSRSRAGGWPARSCRPLTFCDAPHPLGLLRRQHLRSRRGWAGCRRPARRAPRALSRRVWWPARGGGDGHRGIIRAAARTSNDRRRCLKTPCERVVASPPMAATERDPHRRAARPRCRPARRRHGAVGLPRRGGGRRGSASSATRSRTRATCRCRSRRRRARAIRGSST